MTELSSLVPTTEELARVRTYWLEAALTCLYALILNTEYFYL